METVTVYNIPNFEDAISMNRSEFYDEQILKSSNKVKPTRAVEHVQILLFSNDGELLLQKRSTKKRHNPGLIDKTVGGHVSWGDTPFFTAVLETLQELSVPSLLLSADEDFHKNYSLLKEHVSRAAFIQFIDTKTYNSVKIIDSLRVPIAVKYHFFIGVYNGPVKPHDKEVAGVMFYNLDQLLSEIDEDPKNFTSDLIFYLKKYIYKIREFLDNI